MEENKEEITEEAKTEKLKEILDDKVEPEEDADEVEEDSEGEPVAV